MCVCVGGGVGGWGVNSVNVIVCVCVESVDVMVCV